MGIRQQKPEKGKKIQAHPSSSELAQKNPPTFSLRYLDKGYCLSKCEQEEKAAFADTLHKLSQLTWQQINQAPRHGLGFEKLAGDSIKGTIPPHLRGQDVNFIAFRFHGQAPMVGYRDQSVFYVIWLDRAFTLYNHG